MNNKAICFFSLMAASLFATACAGSADVDSQETETRVDAVARGKDAPASPSGSTVNPQNVSACSSADWATANNHAANNHSVWSPASGMHWAHATSCSVSGNTITYTWAVEY